MKTYIYLILIVLWGFNSNILFSQKCESDIQLNHGESKLYKLNSANSIFIRYNNPEITDTSFLTNGINKIGPKSEESRFVLEDENTLKFSDEIRIKLKQAEFSIHINQCAFNAIVTDFKMPTLIPTPTDSEEDASFLPVRRDSIGISLFNDARNLVRIDDTGYKSETDRLLEDNLINYYYIDLTTSDNLYFKSLENKLVKYNEKGSGFNNIPFAKADVTNFATGMARFLAERAKQELNESFFKAMLNKIDSLPELQHFFGNSYHYLKTTLDQNRMINLNNIKDIFERDIQQFPINLYDIKYLDTTTYKHIANYNRFINNVPNGQWVDLGLTVLMDNNWKLNPKDLLQSINSKKLKYLEEKYLYGNIIDKVKIGALEGKFNRITQNYLELIKNENDKKLFISVLEKHIPKKPDNTFILSSFLQLKTILDSYVLPTDYREQIQRFLTEESIVFINNIERQKKHNFINSLKLIELISSSLLSTDDDRYWISNKEINELFNNRKLLEVYIGLLITKSEFPDYRISFMKEDGKLISLKSLLNHLYKDQNYMKFRDLIRDLHTTFVAVDNIVKSINEENAQDKIANIQRLFSFVGESVHTFNTYFQNRKVFGEELPFQIDKEIFPKFISPCIDIALHLQNKEYALAIDDAVMLLTNIQNDVNYTKAIESAKKVKSKYDFLTQFARYGTVIANVAVAENSDQVKAAIEASVMPVGSSRLKRHSTLSLSLNAYVGGFFGYGFYKENGSTKTIPTYGITAPIGVSFNIGRIGKPHRFSAFSLTGQLIDLGSLVNFYLKKGNEAALPPETKIQLGDIIAPGIQTSWSFGDTPFSANFGIQYVPNLSRMSAIEGSNQFRSAAYRIQLGVVVDIPLFNLKVWHK